MYKYELLILNDQSCTEHNVYVWKYLNELTDKITERITSVAEVYFKKQKIRDNKKSVIHDPLGQAHSFASSKHWFYTLFWKVGTDERTDERTTCAKTIIPNGRECGSA